jgi:hypothetical protein
VFWRLTCKPSVSVAGGKNCGSQELGVHQMTQELYHFANIRKLLTDGFNDQELRNLCFDVPGFRPVYEDLTTGTSKGEIVAKLLEHAEKTLQVDILLARAKELNRARYEAYQPYYLANTTSTLQEQPANLTQQSSASPKKTNGIPKNLRRAAIGVAAIIVLVFGVWVGSHWQQLFDTSVSIESLSSRLFTWGGDFDSDPTSWGSSSMAINFVEQSYEVSYSLPKEDNVWTGMSFILSPQNKNLKSYKAIELTLDLGAGTGCILSIMDDKGSKNDISLGGTTPPSNDITVETTKQGQRITIPLATNFHSVDLESVKEIQFHVDAYFPRGSNKFVVGNIRLLK